LSVATGAVQSGGSRTGQVSTDTGAPAGSGASGQATGAAANGAATANVVANLGVQAANGAPAAAMSTASAPAVPIAGLAVEIAARARGGCNKFDIRLDPPELGRIDVRLDVDRNGQVTSHVTVERADTLQLLQSQQPQLQRALEQAGLTTTNNGLQFTLRDQSGQNGAGGNGGQPPVPQLVIPDPKLSAIDTTQIYSRWNIRGGLDIRV
jgi:chemotaxis protein MotD